MQVQFKTEYSFGEYKSISFKFKECHNEFQYIKN
jgi:hypothetical protein